LLLAGEDDEFHGVGEVGGFELQFVVSFADFHTRCTVQGLSFHKGGDRLGRWAAAKDVGCYSLDVGSRGQKIPASPATAR
jgi:hypothetical protein